MAMATTRWQDENDDDHDDNDNVDYNSDGKDGFRVFIIPMVAWPLYAYPAQSHETKHARQVTETSVSNVATKKDINRQKHLHNEVIKIVMNAVLGLHFHNWTCTPWQGLLLAHNHYHEGTLCFMEIGGKYKISLYVMPYYWYCRREKIYVFLNMHFLLVPFQIILNMQYWNRATIFLY